MRLSYTTPQMLLLFKYLVFVVRLNECEIKINEITISLIDFKFPISRGILPDISFVDKFLHIINK